MYSLGCSFDSGEGVGGGAPSGGVTGGGAASGGVTGGGAASGGVTGGGAASGSMTRVAAPDYPAAAHWYRRAADAGDGRGLPLVHFSASPSTRPLLGST